MSLVCSYVGHYVISVPYSFSADKASWAKKKYIAWTFAWMFSVGDYVAIFIHNTVQAVIRKLLKRPKCGLFDASAFLMETTDCDKYTLPVRHSNNLLNSFPCAPIIFPNDKIIIQLSVLYNETELIWYYYFNSFGDRLLLGSPDNSTLTRLLQLACLLPLPMTKADVKVCWSQSTR